MFVIIGEKAKLSSSGIAGRSLNMQVTDPGFQNMVVNSMCWVENLVERLPFTSLAAESMRGHWEPVDSISWN
jgi:hypothetical protein